MSDFCESVSSTTDTELTVDNFWHQCEVCDVNTINIDAMIEHMKKHDGKNPTFTCEVVVDGIRCGFVSTNIDKIKDHVAYAHTNVRFCRTCWAGYSVEPFLQIHYRKELY